jgi:hypothetical protein
MQQCSLFPSPIHRFHLSFHFLFSPPILYLHPPHRLGLRLHGVAPCGACKFLRPRCVLECVTIAYEAQASLRDPVYGCVAQTFTLQQHAKPKAQLAYGGVQQGTGTPSAEPPPGPCSTRSKGCPAVPIRAPRSAISSSPCRQLPRVELLI